MSLVEIVDVVDSMAESDERSDDGSGAGAKYEVESLVQITAKHRFDLSENAERVESLGATAVESENPAHAVTRKLGR
jgi:hypothetical protein